MKINGLQPQEVYKAFVKDNPCTCNSQSKADAGHKTDSLEISQQCTDLNEACRLADESGIFDVSEDGREEKIEELKSLIEQGQYNVPAADVAKSIISGKFLDTKA